MLICNRVASGECQVKDDEFCLHSIPHKPYVNRLGDGCNMIFDDCSDFGMCTCVEVEE